MEPWTDLAAVRDELCALVARSHHPVVAFDADSTLWYSDVANRLWDHLLARRCLRPEALAPIAAALAEHAEPGCGDPHRDVARLLELYAAGRACERTIVSLQATALAGFTVEELRALAAASFATPGRTLAGACFEGMAELVDGVRRLGARVVVVSGSPQIVVEEGVRLYGIDAADVYALRSRVAAGRFVAALDGPITSGEGKVEAYRTFGLPAPLAVFGDSPSDLPLMRVATGMAGLVNPRPGLLRSAATIPAPVRRIRVERTVSGERAVLPDQDESTLL